MLPILLLVATLSVPGSTVILDPAAKAQLLGRHGFTVQWLRYGKAKGAATVVERDGVLHLQGEHRHAPSGNWAVIDGVITEVAARQFRFRGRIEVRVDFLANGRPCRREGEFTFRITGARRFWRLKEMENPCSADGTVDYVDLHFKE